MEEAPSLEAHTNPPAAAVTVDAISTLARPHLAAGPLTVSTDSTDSVRTLRDLHNSPNASTPALTAIGAAASTPSLLPGSPASHQPFTTLSPTVTPSPAKAAKNLVAQEFKNAGLVPTAGFAAPNIRAGNALLGPTSSVSKPNIVEFAIQLQSEPGLTHWWSAVTQTLREHFGAERATLAVATDSTDVENVPWAQLATFWAADDDDLSRTVNEPHSSQSSLRDMTSPDSIGGDSVKSKATTTQKLRMPGGIAGIDRPNSTPGTRPKLEMRHSYAGHPPRHKFASASTDHISPPSSFKPLSPSTQNSFREISSFEAGMELNEELLRYHDLNLPGGKGSSDDYTPTSPTTSRILQPQQPLESEADPLITSTGVLRVFGRQHATVLTREYLDGPEGTYSVSRPLRSPHITPGRGEPKRSPGVTAKSHTSGKHPRRRRVETSKSSSGTGNTDPSPAAAMHAIAYEDYEQFPGTPWSQSPAPSPAERGDPNENPFFSIGPDQEAFAENPPPQQYSGHSPIPAIGVDRARSIIQLPLIHPSARLSHTLNSRAVREDSKSKHKGMKASNEKPEKPNIVRHGSAPSSDTFTIKRIPIAILSIMASNVPYPPELIDSLNEMAPLLATSFYTARSHSNIIFELAALSGRRHVPGLKLNVHDELILGDIAAAAGLNLMGPSARVRSPISPISSASTSTHSTTAFQSTREQSEAGSTSATPVWDRLDPLSRGGDGRKSASPADGARDSHEDYFSKRTRRRGSHDHLTSPASTARSAAPNRSATGRSKKTIHSGGATFASTQPSLPGAASYVTGVDDHLNSSGLQADDGFREPSSSVLRTMIDNGATQQFIAEPDHGHLIWANAKFMAYRNASKDNIHEQLWSNIYHKDLNRFQTEWHRSLESGEQLSHQVRLKRFDGQYRYFHMRFLPLKDKYGVTKYWHGQAMDIHDLHEAEVKAAKSKEKLASEAKYRALANSLPVIVFAASVPTGMTFANTQWLSYSGQGLEEALGFGFLDHVHPADLIKCRFPGVPEASSTPNSRKEHRTRPGVNPIIRSDTSVSSTAESEETTTTIKAFSRSTSRDEPDVPSELLRGLAKDGIITWARDQHNILAITTEMRLRDSHGEYHWHLVQGSYIESVNFGQGDAQWFIACTDISNQKQNEAKIQQANSALEDVNTALEKEMRQKMSYLSSMSHEIRTPLNGIIGNLQFLINSGLEETASEWAHGAQEAAKNMHDLINDILDLSKAEANMLQLASHWFNPRGLMEQVLDMLNSKAAEKEIELCCESTEDLPKMIRGDSGRIRQVLLNLVGNAIKFTRAGEVSVSCERSDKVPDGHQLPDVGPGETFIKWTVTDTGTGFTPEDRKLLFKPYSQIKNRSTRDIGGTGLGLILCKTMVTLHGGSIDASSKPGLGSTFSFFARFKVRQDSAAKKIDPRSSLLAPVLAPSAGTIPGSIHSGSSSPIVRAVDVMRDSPGPLSDSSSSKSITSMDNRRSIHSSISTAESVAPMKLTLPPHPTATRPPDVSLTITTKVADLVSPTNRPETESASSKSADRTSSQRSPLISPRTLPSRTAAADLERANFRPPMVSALVVCQAENARRITCDQIRSVVPRTVPCHATGVATIQAALNLLHGEEPITFTHIVLRLSSETAIHQAVQTVLAEPKHDRACIVVLADQGQIKAIMQVAPELDLETLAKEDRLKLVMKPVHTFKLAKIFDPFNENALAIKDPKEAKRTEEKRLQKESYALFKKVLGNKGIRVLAIEDNKLQMDILHNFLAKICCLDTIKAWNGQEGLDLYKSHDAGYYSVIITDIEMPIMDGLTMCRRIRSWEQLVGRPPVPVVSLSANSFAEGWNQSSAAGFSHFCPKPVQFRDLGYILLELTDPAIPHKYLSERQMPKHMLKKLGLLPLDEEDSDEEIEL